MARIKRALMTFDISSTSVGYVLAPPNGGLISGSFQPTSKDLRRVVEIGNAMETWAEMHAHDFQNGLEVWVEQPFYSKGASHDLPIKMTHGVVLKAFANVVNPLRFCWNYVNVNTWRAHLNGCKLSSAEKKLRVMRDVENEFGIKPANDDEGDALGIFSWCLKEMKKHYEV